MDSVSLIIAALIAGTTKAARDIAPDTYQALKSLIKRRFAGKPHPNSEDYFVGNETNYRSFSGKIAPRLIKSAF